MNDENNKCFFCDQRNGVRVTEKPLVDVYEVDCPYCKRYFVTEEAIDWIREKPSSERTKLGAYNCHYILENPKSWITYYRKEPEESIGPKEKTRIVSEILENWWPKTIRERLDLVMLNLQSKLGDKPGKEMGFQSEDFPFLMGEDREAGFYILERLQEAGWVKILNPNEGIPRRVELTLKGFDRIDELKKGFRYKESRIVFVAMSFHDDLSSVYEMAIAPAIWACGYQPLRVDREEHNEKICEKIEASIRQSRFVVADFTHNKQGVYYEVGLARGLGLPVVWSVKNEKIETDNLHFDTRQYNHIFWGNEDELKKKLENRIRALGL